MRNKLMALVIGGLLMLGQSVSANQTMTTQELQSKLNAKENFVLLDVRTQEEYNAGYIAGAILLPYDEINAKATIVLPDKEKEIVLYCRSGRRSAIAKKSLLDLGYQKVVDFGGVKRWEGELVRNK
ncbi:MAG: rhodanese-like domain-containing protein [Phascolarctobacterium sp.]|nr:rhodanese-like domain-containing protein [Phascolarctobacterium sp.]MBQ3113075.1 rhodanese-like domain-containing protein [Phascolarctobacterium sp.]MBQ7021320.1 rhodanese-like domain-containing protein [Phascolarctobacterium sp.]